MPESRTSVRRISAARRQAEALRLRGEGYGFQAIADALGYRGPSGAHQAVMRGLKATLQEPADELRVLEAERLNRLYEFTMQRIDKDNLWAVDRALKIMERRAGLLGLDQTPSPDFGSHIGSFMAGVDTATQMQAEDLSEKPSGR